MTREVWLPVPLPGFGEWYQVSDRGRVRSWRVSSPVILSGKRNTDAHVQVKINKRMHLVHVLVLEAFVGPRPDGHVSRHLNGIPFDNRLRNLVWGTQAENAADTVRHGGHPQARKTRCVNGHPFDAENTYVHPKTGQRSCRACRRAARKRHRSQSQQTAVSCGAPAPSCQVPCVLT